MKATQLIHNVGQSIWLDSLSRDLLDSGALQRYIDELSVTGVTSNVAILERAIKSSTSYDADIARVTSCGSSPEDIFFELEVEDATRAAHALWPVHELTNGVDGWVSVEISPLLAYDTKGTVRAGKDLYAKANCRNVFVKVPGTTQGLAAAEELIFAGVPVNVTLLFSREQYLGAAEAFLRGIEKRLLAGLNPNITSVASVFVNPWDAAVNSIVRPRMRNQLGIAVAKRTYRAARALTTSAPWQRMYNAGARPQRLLWASTGAKDPTASAALYIKALVAPYTANTLPEDMLLFLAKQHRIDHILFPDGNDCEDVLAQFVEFGIDLNGIADQLQQGGLATSIESWNGLMAVIGSRSETFRMAAVNG